MGENIEVKDVQKTEYLDKNGLDMLWAKVKENTRNQVEVERNRAVAKENSIIDTKADATALSNYVLTTALNQQVDTLNTAISAKQDAGNYIPYENYENGKYTYKLTKPHKIQFGRMYLGDYYLNTVGGDGILFEKYGYSHKDDEETVKYSFNGITSNKYDDCLATSDASFKPISDFVLKTELPAVPTKTSELTNDSNFITAADVDLTPYATIEALTAVEQKVTANTTAIANINKSNGIPYDTNITNYYQTDKPFYIKCDNDHTAYINPYAGIKVASSDTSYVDITPSVMKLSDGNASCEINEYLGGIQCLSGTNDDSKGFRLGYDGLRIGEKSSITQSNNGELISISIPYSNSTSAFKVSPHDGIKLSINDSQVALNTNGITIPNGDDNHVLTSQGSTIDITNYVLKSVYDEKIVALEARIAALEAKHTEAAA